MNARAVTDELRRMFPTTWRMSRRYRLPSGSLGEPYYIRWSAAPKPDGEGWCDADFDAGGVLLTDGAREPVPMAQFALHAHDRFRRGKPGARARFLAHAEALLQAQDMQGAFLHVRALPLYGAGPGWISAMAQGEAVSVFLRAHAVTGEPRYRAAARAALAPLLRDVRDGGAAYIKGGDLFFEEVATPEPAHILNGHLFAAFGVWEALRAGIGDDALRVTHEAAIGTLRRWLPRYDRDGWSRYDLARDARGREHPAPLWYHHFHIAQLRVYAAMTGEALFAEYAERWERALDDRRVRARIWGRAALHASEALLRRVLRRPGTTYLSADRS